MMRHLGHAGLIGAALFTLPAPAGAAEEGAGCEKFAWSIAPERAWFAASNRMKVTAGETLAIAPADAFVVRLQPAAQAAFAMPPERKPRAAEWFGGMVRFPAMERAGIYQVTLSEEAWVDIVQDGRYARSVGSTGRSDCPGVRKSLRVEIGSTPFVLQLSGVAADTITVSIRPRD